MRAKSRVQGDGSVRIKGGQTERAPMTWIDRFVYQHKTLASAIFLIVVFGGIWAWVWTPWNWH